MIRAGVALVDITPPAGLEMAGFAARITPATGAHDALTVRALALDEIVILIADVIGVDRDLCDRVGAALGLGPDRLMIAASHTHGGPASMPGRLSLSADRGFMQRLEQGCITAARDALAARRPSRLRYGMGTESGFASNRRHPGGPVDRALPVLRIEQPDGTPYAILTICACHPVVLGADNLLWTADYHHFFRAALERDLPGVMALTATGFCGDVNTGHSAHASLSTAPQAMRSFAQAEKMGEALAAAVLQAPLTLLGNTAADQIAESAGAQTTGSDQPPNSDALAPVALGAAADLALAFQPQATSGTVEAAAWRTEAATAPPERARILQLWADWAETRVISPSPLSSRVQAFALGPLRMIGLPGEIFAQSALDLRAALGPRPAFLFGYAGDNPGYIAPAAEYPFGGYEVDEAHRLYGPPAAFQPGSAESLVDAALTLCRGLEIKTKRQSQGEPA